MNKAKLWVLPFVGFLLPFDCAVALGILLTEMCARRSGCFTVRRPSCRCQTTRVTIQILNWDGKHLLQEFLPSVLELHKITRLL